MKKMAICFGLAALVMGLTPGALAEEPTVEEAAEEGMSNVGGLKLMGITAAKNGKSKAVINDKIVSKGSTIGKFKVVDIWPDRVIVLDREEKTEIELKL